MQDLLLSAKKWWHDKAFEYLS